jgi:hypothetical protein
MITYSNFEAQSTYRRTISFLWLTSFWSRFYFIVSGPIFFFSPVVFTAISLISLFIHVYASTDDYEDQSNVNKPGNEIAVLEIKAICFTNIIFTKPTKTFTADVANVIIFF